MTQTKESGRISPEALLRLWREYKQTGDARTRDRLVLTLAPVVKYSGLEALVRSIDRYDPERGATLEQFGRAASARSTAQLKRGLRRQLQADEQLFLEVA